MYSGGPRRMNRSVRASTTSTELSFRFTRIARASFVNSSMMLSVRKIRPSCVRSWTEAFSADCYAIACQAVHRTRHGSGVPAAAARTTHPLPGRALHSNVPRGVQPESTLLGLFLRDFQPLPLPDPFDPFMVHMPAAVVQHVRDHTIAVSSELFCQRDDVIGQPFFVRQATGHLALRRAMLTQCAANPALRYAEGLPHMINAQPAAGRA